MNRKAKNRCIIFSHKNFASSGMKEREVTDEDAEALRSLFKNMGLAVSLYKDFTSSAIISTFIEC